MAILHLSYFLEFNCWSFWKATCNRRVSRTEQFQCTPTRRNLSTTSKNKCTALSGHHFCALGKSSRTELQSSPKSHIQSEIKMLWCLSHFRPGHQPPHQLLSATSQRCASMRALQLTRWRWTRDARTENGFKATASTTLVPGIYPVESCNTLTTPLMQWPLTQAPTTWSMLKAFTGALHMGKPDSKCMTAFHEYSHPRLHGIGTPSRCFTEHHTHPWD